MKVPSPFILLALLAASQAVLGDDLPTLNTKKTTSTTSKSTTTSSTHKTTSTSSTKYTSSHLSITSSTHSSASSTLSSSATRSSSTSSYTYTATVPTVKSPFVTRYHDVSGTVFIAVGSIIFSILFLLGLLRFWFHYKSRRDAYKSDKFDQFYNGSGDHFGGGSGAGMMEKKKSGLFYEKSMNDYESTLLPYDSDIFASKRSLIDDSTSEKRNSNDQTTIYPSKTNNSMIFKPRSANVSATNLQDLNNSVSQPGHQLRKALNMNSSTSLPITTKTPQQKRFSFISPINDLILQTQHFQQPVSYVNSPQGESFLETSSPNVTIDDNKSIYMHDTNSSGNLLSNTNLGLGLGLMNNNNSSVSHHRQTSNYEEFYSMIEKSLVKSNNNVSDGGSTENETPSKTHKRPPSMQLDDLLKGSPL